MHVLKIPAVVSKSEALALAATLEATGAFQDVHPAFEVATSSKRGADAPSQVLPLSDTTGLEHLIAMRFPAAWNAGALADTHAPVKVLVVDNFAEAVPLELSYMSFIEGAGTATLPGNHGYQVIGIVGARFDSASPTGTHPNPAAKLNLVGLRFGGMSWLDTLIDLTHHFPDDPFFVMNTSLGIQRSRVRSDTISRPGFWGRWSGAN